MPAASCLAEHRKHRKRWGIYAIFTDPEGNPFGLRERDDSANVASAAGVDTLIDHRRVRLEALSLSREA
jgi:cytochrome c1